MSCWKFECKYIMEVYLPWAKSWIGGWQTHVDSLKDGITDPLYKTVFHKHTHSTTTSIAHLSMLGVWAATVNLGTQVYSLVAGFCESSAGE